MKEWSIVEERGEKSVEGVAEPRAAQRRAYEHERQGEGKSQEIKTNTFHSLNRNIKLMTTS